jgi:hypothetical protein
MKDKKLNDSLAMELCHARYDFECISRIHTWLQHVLLDYTRRTTDENLHHLDDLRSALLYF